MNISPKVWPIGIVISIIAVAFMCIWTIKVAQSNPVQLDNTYFTSYQDLDMNANKIILEQQAFDKKYKIIIAQKDFIIGENSIEIKLTDKEQNAINNANIDVVITRPHTTATDKKLSVLSSKDGVYKMSHFEVKELGRWQIQSKVMIDNLTAYNKLEVNATN
jgi:nitrogen fixation protein FixH